MREFIKTYFKFLIMLMLWVLSGMLLNELSYVVVPISVILLWRNGEFFKVLLGLLLILFLSDNLQPILSFAKTLKSIYMLLIGLLFVFSSEKFFPKSKLFIVFLPFIIYSYFSLLFAGTNIVIASQKTISYSILLLTIPSLVVKSIHDEGVEIIKDILYFFAIILLVGVAIKFINFDFVSKGERFSNLLGNPNGLGIFLLLFYLLFRVTFYLSPESFSRGERLFIYGLIAYNLFLCSSRTAMGGIAFFFIAEKLFKASSFIAVLLLILGLFSLEYFFILLPKIITNLGLEEYFRLHTLEDGSGRFLAWTFAWDLIQEKSFFFGGGFGFDEFNMRKFYEYLKRLGHSGGVHNSYLSMWFNFGLVGIIIYFRSFFLSFYQAHKKHIIALPLMFTVMFSITYESWLVASLNPFTILLVIMLATLMYVPSKFEIDNLAEEL